MTEPGTTQPTESTPEDMPLRDLLRQLREDNARMLRDMLPRLRGLVDKALGERHRRYDEQLESIGRELTALRNQIEEHLLREQQTLLAFLDDVEAARRGERPLPEWRPTVRTLEEERKDLLEMSDRAARLAADFPPADDAPSAWLELEELLSDLESTMDRHLERGTQAIERATEEAENVEQQEGG